MAWWNEFRTDDQSVHGFPVPVAKGKWRRSVALYYYTVAPTDNLSGDETTYSREHGERVGVARKSRFLVYRGLLRLSRTVSMLANAANPNCTAPRIADTTCGPRGIRRDSPLNIPSRSL